MRAPPSAHWGAASASSIEAAGNGRDVDAVIRLRYEPALPRGQAPGHILAHMDASMERSDASQLEVDAAEAVGRAVTMRIGGRIRRLPPGDITSEADPALALQVYAFEANAAGDRALTTAGGNAVPLSVLAGIGPDGELAVPMRVECEGNATRGTLHISVPSMRLSAAAIAGVHEAVRMSESGAPEPPRSRSRARAWAGAVRGGRPAGAAAAAEPVLPLLGAVRIGNAVQMRGIVEATRAYVQQWDHERTSMGETLGDAVTGRIKAPLYVGEQARGLVSPGDGVALRAPLPMAAFVMGDNTPAMNDEWYVQQLHNAESLERLEPGTLTDWSRFSAIPPLRRQAYHARALTSMVQLGTYKADTWTGTGFGEGVRGTENMGTDRYLIGDCEDSARAQIQAWIGLQAHGHASSDPRVRDAAALLEPYVPVMALTSVNAMNTQGQGAVGEGEQAAAHIGALLLPRCRMRRAYALGVGDNGPPPPSEHQAPIDPPSAAFAAAAPGADEAALSPLLMEGTGYFWSGNASPAQAAGGPDDVVGDLLRSGPGGQAMAGFKYPIRHRWYDVAEGEDEHPDVLALRRPARVVKRNDHEFYGHLLGVLTPYHLQRGGRLAGAWVADPATGRRGVPWSAVMAPSAEGEPARFHLKPHPPLPPRLLSAMSQAMRACEPPAPLTVNGGGAATETDPAPAPAPPPALAAAGAALGRAAERAPSLPLGTGHLTAHADWYVLGSSVPGDVAWGRAVAARAAALSDMRNPETGEPLTDADSGRPLRATLVGARIDPLRLSDFAGHVWRLRTTYDIREHGRAH